MLTLTNRLGTLDAKGRVATRTAKDGQEYSQLIFEVLAVELGESEVNAIFGSPQAFAKLQALAGEVKGIKAVEVEEKFEEASVYLRLNAVGPAPGEEYKFEGCVVDKLKLTGTAGPTMVGAFRVTSKPALNGKFGELISRLGHTVMVEVSGSTASDQTEMPLNSADGEHKPSVGTPEQEKAETKRRGRAAEERLRAEMN
jgi:hypothetical protein